MPFAKLWEHDIHGQILCKRDRNSQNSPEINIYWEPIGFGVCHYSIGFNDSPAGYRQCELLFNNATIEMAVKIIDKHCGMLQALRSNIQDGDDLPRIIAQSFIVDDEDFAEEVRDLAMGKFNTINQVMDLGAIPTLRMGNAKKKTLPPITRPER